MTATELGELVNTAFDDVHFVEHHPGAAADVRAPHADRPRAVAHRSTAVEHQERRARAFRVMAGVRV